MQTVSLILLSRVLVNRGLEGAESVTVSLLFELSKQQEAGLPSQPSSPQASAFWCDSCLAAGGKTVRCLLSTLGQ